MVSTAAVAGSEGGGDNDEGKMSPGHDVTGEGRGRTNLPFLAAAALSSTGPPPLASFGRRLGGTYLLLSVHAHDNGLLRVRGFEPLARKPCGPDLVLGEGDWASTGFGALANLGPGDQGELCSYICKTCIKLDAEGTLQHRQPRKNEGGQKGGKSPPPKNKSGRRRLETPFTGFGNANRHRSE